MRLSMTIVFFVTVFSAYSLDDVTVTVKTGERQSFKGFGVGQINMFDRNATFFEMPRQTQEEIYRFMFSPDELDFRYFRLWSLLNDCPKKEAVTDYCAQTEAIYTKTVYDLAKKFQPNLVTLMGPWTRPWMQERLNDLRRWAAGYAHQIKRFEEYGVKYDYTGIANEPDNHELLLDYQAPLLIRYFREELDKQGLQHVKIVGPENTSADDKAVRFMNNIINDPAALSAIDGFATHSYNTSITEEMERTVSPYVSGGNSGGNKEYWQTECSDFGPEEFGSMWRASACAARFLADMNHLCTVWFHYLNIAMVGSHWGNPNSWSDWNSFHMVSYRQDELDWKPLLKCYYYKQLSKTFRPGTVLRKAHTDLKQRNREYYWRAEDSTMVYAGSFGPGQRKAPIYLAAGTFEGSWRIGVTNYSGNVPPEPIAVLVSEKQFRVQVDIEELRSVAEMRFKAFRNNNQEPYIHPLPDVVMRNGVLVIDSLGSFDMITLHSVSGSAKSSSISKKPAGSVSLVPGKSSFLLEYNPGLTLVEKNNDVCDFSILDCRGVSLIQGPMTRSADGLYRYHHVSRQGNDRSAVFANGAYFVRIRDGRNIQVTPLIVSR